MSFRLHGYYAGSYLAGSTKSTTPIFSQYWDEETFANKLCFACEESLRLKLLPLQVMSNVSTCIAQFLEATNNFWYSGHSLKGHSREDTPLERTQMQFPYGGNVWYIAFNFFMGQIFWRTLLNWKLPEAALSVYVTFTRFSCTTSHISMFPQTGRRLCQ